LIVDSKSYDPIEHFIQMKYSYPAATILEAVIETGSEPNTSIISAGSVPNSQLVALSALLSVHISLPSQPLTAATVKKSEIVYARGTAALCT